MTSPAFQPLEVTDFSGGRTDNYVAGPMNRYQKADNLILIKHGNEAKFLSRFGSKVYSASFPQPEPAAVRLGTIRNFRTTSGDTLLVNAARKLYTLTGGGWIELVGPVTNNSLFPAGTTTDNVTSYSEWNDHLFLTNDSFSAPAKVYNDNTNTIRLRSAGLPRLASSPTCTKTAAGVNNYLYRFVMAYTYTVGTNAVTFIDRSDYTEVAVTLTNAPNVNQINIAAIPVLANGATTNWDTASIKIEIYRTLNNDVHFFKVGEVTNGTVVFVDNFSDAAIAVNQALYTEGGVVGNGPTPLAKLVHVTGDICYWAHVKVGSQILSNRLMQAIPGDPDSVPTDFFVDVQDEIVGISSCKGLPILMCKNSVYRIDGQFDELGRGGMTAQKINDSATCVSSQSVVQTIEGVYWAGEDSYYFSDGYVVKKLCKEWANTYKSRVQIAAQKRRIQGKYDKRKRQIWWTIQESTGGSADVNACDILHLDWTNTEEEIGCFTSASGGAVFAPTAIEFVDGDMLRGDVNGFLLIHQDALTTDPKIDKTDTTALTWSSQAIVWDYKSCATNFSSSFLRKYSPMMSVTCGNRSNLSLQMVSINDDGRRIENLKPIRFRGNVVWGDPTIIWGTPGIVWAFSGLIEDKRHFPSKSLRYSYKQIEMTNAYVVIVNSDLLGTATINATTKVVTLDNASIVDWPTDAIDYFISFERDNYAMQYLIMARTADTITFSDTGSTFTTNVAGSKWEISGYPKGEVFNLISYMVSFTFMGQTQQAFTAAEAGEVNS